MLQPVLELHVLKFLLGLLHLDRLFLALVLVLPIGSLMDAGHLHW